MNLVRTRTLVHTVELGELKKVQNWSLNYWWKTASSSVYKKCTHAHDAHVSTVYYYLLVPAPTRPRNEWRVLACGTAMSISVSTASTPYQCRRPRQRRRRRRPPPHRHHPPHLHIQVIQLLLGHVCHVSSSTIVSYFKKYVFFFIPYTANISNLDILLMLI